MVGAGCPAEWRIGPKARGLPNESSANLPEVKALPCPLCLPAFDMSRTTLNRHEARGYRTTALRARKTPKTGISGTTGTLFGLPSVHRNHNILSHQKKARGFTLVEVLVSVAIMSVLGLCLTMILRSSIGAWREGESRTDTSATAQTAMDRLCSDFAAAFTKSVQPPGPVTVVASTVKDLAGPVFNSDLGEWCYDGASNEWCTVSADKTISINENNLHLGISDFPYTFHFRLRFTTKRARLWITTYGNVALEARAFVPGEEDDGTWSGSTVPTSGDLSDIIEADTTENGTVYGADHIAIRAATEADSSARLMPGAEGPVLRFTAEPDRTQAGDVRFLLAEQTGGEAQPQKVVFVMNSGRRRTNVLGLADDASAGSLAEVCYLTTFDEITPDDAITPGVKSSLGTLWRAVRRPVGDWPVPEDEDPTEAHQTLFERDFIADIAVLAEDVPVDPADPASDTIKVYTREHMQTAGFHPVAENVLYFGVQAWNNDPEWTSDWGTGVQGTPAGIPTKIRIVLTLQPQTSQRTIATLAEGLDAESKTPKIVLDSAKGFRSFAAGSPLERFVKIGDEWIYYDNVSEARKLIFDDRDPEDPALTQEQKDDLLRLLREPDRPREYNRDGFRGSAAAGHEAGTDVHQGETYVRTIVLPYPKQLDNEDALP